MDVSTENQQPGGGHDAAGALESSAVKGMRSAAPPAPPAAAKSTLRMQHRANHRLYMSCPDLQAAHSEETGASLPLRATGSAGSLGALASKLDERSTSTAAVLPAGAMGLADPLRSKATRSGGVGSGYAGGVRGSSPASGGSRSPLCECGKSEGGSARQHTGADR